MAKAGPSEMPEQFVKLRKDPLLKCLTCPLCMNLLTDATTIGVCLHTFCKDCIYRKLEEDRTCTCPLCKVYLGISPHEKLRPDNNLQELRKKLFPPKPQKEEETKPTESTAPMRVKERSLSSLVSEAHPVPRKAGKGRSRSRKASTSWSQKPQTDQQMLDLNNLVDEKKQTEAFKALSIGPKNQRTPTEKEPSRTSARLKAVDKNKSTSPDWEKLTCLAEVADKADDAQKPSLDLTTVENEEGDGMKAKATRRLRSKARKNKAAQQKKEDGSAQNIDSIGEQQKKGEAESSSKGKKDEGKIRSASSVTGQQERDHESLSYEKGKEDVKLKKNYPSGGLLIDLNGDPEPQTSDEQSTQVASAYGCSSVPAKKLNPVWFSLIASKEQRGDPLPQIAKSQIRIKDGSMPVCYVNKFLVHKLNLKDESEVEVTCCGQSLIPTEPLNSVADIWLENLAKNGKGKGKGRLPKLEQLCADNAHSFMMVLTYARKCGPP